jgi:hypothetical protein
MIGDGFMNKRQATILMAGLTLGFFATLNPPRVLRDAPAVREPRGFLFSHELYLHQTYDPVTRMGTSVTHYLIDKDRLLLEWAAIGWATAALVVAFRTWGMKAGGTIK